MWKNWVIVMILLVPISALGAEHRLGITPTEAYRLAKEQGGSMLFIDVRDPVEIMFTGFTDSVDQNIPLAITDPFDFDDGQATFRMNFNKNFITEVDKALAKKGLNRDSLIILSAECESLTLTRFLRSGLEIFGATIARFLSC